MDKTLLEAYNSLQSATDSLSAIHFSINQVKGKSLRVTCGLANRKAVLDDIQQTISLLTIDEKTIAAAKSDFQQIGEEFRKAAKKLDETLEGARQAYIGGIMAASETIDEASRLLGSICIQFGAFFVLRLRSISQDYDRFRLVQHNDLLINWELFALLAKYEPERAKSCQKEYLDVAKTVYRALYRRVLAELQVEKIDADPATPLIGCINDASILGKLGRQIAAAFGIPEAGGGTPCPPDPPKVGALAADSPSTLVQGLASAWRSLVLQIRQEAKFHSVFFHVSSEDPSLLRIIFHRPFESFTKRLTAKLGKITNFTELLDLERALRQELEDDNVPWIPTITTEARGLVEGHLGVLMARQVSSLRDVAVHHEDHLGGGVCVVTQRFVGFLAVLLNPHSAGCQSLAQKFSILQASMDRFLHLTATTIHDARTQSLFLINNYDYILHCLEAFSPNGSGLFAEVVQSQERRLESAVEGFAQDELQSHFGGILTVLHRSEGGQQDIRPSELSQALQDFEQHFADRVEAVNSSVRGAFPDRRIATHIVGAVFSRLLAAYGKFLKLHDLMRSRGPGAPPGPPPMTPSQVEAVLRQYYPALTPCPSMHPADDSLPAHK